MAESEKANNSRKKTVILTVLVLFAAAWFSYWLWSRNRETTDDAFVDGRVFIVTPRVNGFVSEILVSDNQKVKEGEVLVLMDPVEYEVALAEAQAGLTEAEATLASFELNVPLELGQTQFKVTGARAELQSLERTLEKTERQEEAALQAFEKAKAQQDQALKDLSRMKELISTGVVSQSALDQAQTDYEVALAGMRAASAEVEAVKKQKASVVSGLKRLRAEVGLAATGKDSAEIKSRQVEAQKARVELAKALVRQAELDLEHTTIKAQAAGYVSRKKIEPGQEVSRGKALMAVVPLSPGEVWITANYKETQLTDVKPGQEVVVEVDAYPDLKLTGRVDSIQAGTGAVFSLFPPENASGNYVKVVQRIPVKIVLDPDQDGLSLLRLGMSVVPTTFTSDR